MKMMNQKLFNQLKDSEKLLKQEISYDRDHNLDVKLDDYFNNPNDIDIEMSDVAQTLSQPTIRMASRLNVHYVDNYVSNDNSMLAITRYDDKHNLNVEDALDVVQKLIKLGRTGITARANHNVAVLRKIHKAEQKMAL